MLKRNVYILYPAGFGGSYVNWAISRSDADLRSTVVDNPINPTSSKELGGVGSAHLHVKIPTHQPIMQHLTWGAAMMPKDKRIYNINVAGDNHNGPQRGNQEFAAQMLLRYDPEGVIINIHDGDDLAIKSYGDINCVTKWPTYLLVHFVHTNQTGLNPYESNTREFRNYFVETAGLFHRGRPIDFKALQNSITKVLNWYLTRGSVQPHEINAQTYPHLEKLKSVDIRSKVFELTCKDVASPGFMQFLDKFLDTAGVSDNFDTSFAKENHLEYIAAQKNLQWFQSFEAWRTTGIIDNYLRSHAIVEAQLIKYIRDNGLLPVNWKSLSIDEINLYRKI